MRPVLTLIGAALAAALAVAASGAPAAATPQTPPTFVLTGGGWGHGVGMCQWGAYRQALEGRTHERILATYYPGTKAGTTAVRKVRVLVGQQRSVRVVSTVPFRVRGADGEVVAVTGSADLDARLRLLVEGRRRPLAGPVRVIPGAGQPLQLGDKRYRGELRLTRSGNGLLVVNVVGLEAYLQGVVPGEVPKDWPLEALKAQAVAARTYAVAGLLTGRAYDLYSDYRSQVYYGVGSEAPATTRAVKETRGRILTYAGKPAQTLYFSSSGGRTKSALDMFGSDLPYLVEVDDPWDDAPGNPNHRWEPLALTGRQLGAKLGIAAPVTGVTTVAGAPGAPAVMRFTTSGGGVVEKRVTDLRWTLGLLSTSFRIGVLQLTRPAGPVPAGTKTTLSGIARDVDEPVLERRLASGAWRRVIRLRPRPDGGFTVPLRLTTTTTYRLSAGGVPGPAVTVKVAAAPQ